jgi:hypothetical protein
MAIEVNVTKEIGSFIKIKKQWNSHWVYEKSNAKSMDIDMETNLLLLQSYTRQKSLKAVKKRWIWWMFSFAACLLFGLAYNQLAQFKKAKEMLEMG